VVGHAQHLCRQFLRLTHRYETGTKRVGQSRRENEPARLHPDHEIDLGVPVVVLKPVDDTAQSHRIFQEGRNIVKENTGLRKVRHAANQLLEIFHWSEPYCHTWSRDKTRLPKERRIGGAKKRRMGAAASSFFAPSLLFSSCSCCETCIPE